MKDDNETSDVHILSEGISKSALEGLEGLFEPKHDPDRDINSRVPHKTLKEANRKLAESLPVFALGHESATVRELSRQLFEKLMVIKFNE